MPALFAAGTVSRTPRIISRAYSTDSGGPASPAPTAPSASGLLRRHRDSATVVTLPDGGTVSLVVQPQSTMTGTVQALVTGAGSKKGTYLTIERLY